VPRSYSGSVMAALSRVALLSLNILRQTGFGHIDVGQWAVDRFALLEKEYKRTSRRHRA
jgi:hypothetical protein